MPRDILWKQRLGQKQRGHSEGMSPLSSVYELVLHIAGDIQEEVQARDEGDLVGPPVANVRFVDRGVNADLSIHRL